MTAPLPADAAPPQPPLPQDGEETPPVVDGIDSPLPSSEQGTSEEHLQKHETGQESEREVSQSADAQLPPDAVQDSSSIDNSLDPVREGDLAAFAELFSRFHSRIERAAAGRKHRPLREAWDTATVEILRAPDRIDLLATSECVIEALRLGCESGKVVIVDACLDCIHRLFEYGHIGSPGDSTDVALDVREGALDELVEMVCSCLEVKDEEIYLRMVQTLLTAATRTRSGLHHSTLLAAVRTIYNIFLNSRTPSIRTTARVSLTQILNLVFARMEAETAEDVRMIPTSFSSNKPTDETEHETGPAVDVPEPARPAEEGGDASSEFATVLQKDAYLLFRALCKLSAKEVSDSFLADNIGVRSKLLSLELLRNLVNNSGPAFRSGDRFIYALRQYLSPSLLTNCMSSSPEVMDVSFDIFEMLLRKETLRPLLKTEIGALFDTVIFRFLESPTAGPMRKRRAITLLHRVSSDRQTMADLFLNYDCDLDSPKIFERIVNVLSTAAEDKTNSGVDANIVASTPGAGQVDTRVLALTSVIQVVRSLRNWSKPIEESKEHARSSQQNSSTDERVDSEEFPDEATQHDVTPASSPVSDEAESEGNISTKQTKSSIRTRSTASSGLLLGTVSEGSDRDTTKFEEALKARRDMAEGITLFNSKPKRGIEYLIETGRLAKSASAVADFLRKAENLDAAMVGEYLGDGNTFSISVMHAYTDLNDFTGQTFDGALRMHLSGFRLPGEAQKIDRIMEKFASRYCECNPETFANADAAYVLAYSTIMLHTDAHNNTIKDKMSKEEFIRNNRGINDGGDLDPVFLGGLYDRIVKQEIRLIGSLKDSAASANAKALDSAAAAVAMDPAQRALKFKEESERLLQQTKVLFANKRRTAVDYTYYSATNVHHARLMFETAWCPVLAAISLNLEEASASSTNIVALCLDGFRNGIAIASTFGMSTAKDAFVSSLAKFTHLNSISEMRAKNVECVRMILAIAALEGNNLGEQWMVIVRAISQLEQIRAIAAGNPGKYLLQKSPISDIGVTMGQRRSSAETNGITRAKTSDVPGLVGSEPSSSGSVTPPFRRSVSGKPPSSIRDGNVQNADGLVQRVDSKAASMATTIAESEIERIFTNSSQLTASGVADFCGALCTVALEELSEAPTPRLFCLQKIIEMAYYNMESRTRLQWGKIWLQMGPFFTSAMCHPNRDVAMYAVDALRQLASKFLDKDELSNFAFQKAFLKPFEMCFSKSKSVQIRELVLTCISQIVLARAANIKSGWKSVFGVLALAADDRVESIMNFGWQIVDSIVRKYVGVIDDVYVDAVTGIAAYAHASLSTSVSLAAVNLLTGRCASSLAEGRALSVLKEQADSSRTENDPEVEHKAIWFTADEDAHIGAWFPILTGLASAMQDDRAAIRAAANDGLYKVLTDHGGHFSPSLWALIFRGVLAPVFDDVRHLSSSSNRNEAAAIGEWATTTGSASLKALVDVFVCHISVTRILLQDLLTLIRSWIQQEAEVVAREGMSVLARLIMTAGQVLEEGDWAIVVKSLGETFVDTMPNEILGPERYVLQNGTKGRSALQLADESREPDGNGVNGTEGNGYAPGHDQIDDDSIVPEDRPRPDEANGESTSPPGEVASPQKIDFRVVRAKCVVQLLLIQLAQETIVSFYRDLSTEHILGLAEALEESYSFAHDFNADIELRYSLWRAGFMNQVPNLLKQETNGLMAYLRIVFWLYLDPDRTEQGSYTEEKVMDLCQKVLQGYIKSCEEAQSKSEERREVVALSPVVSFIINGMIQMSEAQFESHLEAVYDILLDLLESADDRDVRQTITTLFRARIRPVLADESSRPKSAKKRGKTTVDVAQPQLPGTVRERHVHVKLKEERGQAASEICAALSKVGGVRTVVPDGDDENFSVVSAAPDEMLVAGLTSLPFVRSAHVEPVPEVGLD